MTTVFSGLRSIHILARPPPLNQQKTESSISVRELLGPPLEADSRERGFLPEHTFPIRFDVTSNLRVSQGPTPEISLPIERGPCGFYLYSAVSGSAGNALGILFVLLPLQGKTSPVGEGLRKESLGVPRACPLDNPNHAGVGSLADPGVQLMNTRLNNCK